MALNVSLNLNDILRTAIVATQRTAAFLALGLRTADQEPPSSLALWGASNLQILPEPLPSELARNILAEWRVWVIGAALRELDGVYALFLERAFEAALLIESHGSTFGPIRHRDLRTFKGKTNTRDRLETLSARIGYASNVAGHFHSVSTARNILTHNAGIVRPSDCNEGEAFSLTWIGMDIVISSIDQQAELLRHRGDTPFPRLALPEGGDVSLAVVERSRRFNIGQAVVATPHDLHEICMMYRCEADRVMNAIKALSSTRDLSVPPPAADDT